MKKNLCFSFVVLSLFLFGCVYAPSSSGEGAPEFVVEFGDQVPPAFEQKFANCEQTSIQTTILPSLTYRGDVLGAEAGNCNVKFRFIQHPVAEWRTADMVCRLDNSLDFETAVDDAFDNRQCEGTLWDLINEGGEPSLIPLDSETGSVRVEADIGSVQPPRDSGSQSSTGSARQAEPVSGEMGQTLTSGDVELTLHGYAYEYNLESGERSPAPEGQIYLVLNLTLKNMGEESIFNPLSKMKVSTALTDNTGSRCSDQAPEVMLESFSPAALQANQSKSGLVACVIPRDSRNVDFKFDEVVTVSLFRYLDVADSLLSEGPVGGFVSNPHSSLAIRVNSVDFIRNASGGSGTSFSPLEYRGVRVRGQNSDCFDDYRALFGYLTLDDCSLVLVDLTVRFDGRKFGDIQIPWRTTFGLGRIRLTTALLNATTGAHSRPHHQSFYEVLDTPLNLGEMAYGEERTGKLIYAVGGQIPDREVDLYIGRSTPAEFGAVSVSLK